VSVYGNKPSDNLQITVTPVDNIPNVLKMLFYDHLCSGFNLLVFNLSSQQLLNLSQHKTFRPTQDANQS